MAAAEPDRWVTVPAAGSIDEVAERVADVVTALIERRAGR
jgi:thymidylate kinase